MDKYHSTPNEKLAYEVGKNFETAIIGGLSSIELLVGNMNEENREKFMEMWPDCRNDILNKGNKQKRIATANIKDNYVVKTHNYETVFKTGNR